MKTYHIHRTLRNGKVSIVTITPENSGNWGRVFAELLFSGMTDVKKLEITEIHYKDGK